MGTSITKSCVKLWINPLFYTECFGSVGNLSTQKLPAESDGKLDSKQEAKLLKPQLIVNPIWCLVLCSS